MADRRWWRSAATASASTSPIPFTALSIAQFYPEGIEGWMVKLDVNSGGGIAPTPNSLSNGRRRIGRIRLDLRVATHHRTHIVIPKWFQGFGLTNG